MPKPWTIICTIQPLWLVETKKINSTKIEDFMCWHTEISDNSTVNTRFIYLRHMVFLVYWQLLTSETMTILEFIYLLLPSTRKMWYYCYCILTKPFY
jgi:hypothetical protein